MGQPVPRKDALAPSAEASRKEEYPRAYCADVSHSEEVKAGSRHKIALEVSRCKVCRRKVRRRRPETNDEE